MKKQTLFDLASMPKMVLIITLVVMLGVLFGATSYLLKTPKTDLPIINPIIETQCEIDTDCKLVYTGGICTPCGSTLDEGYQCLPREEAAEISRERQRMLIDPEGPQCSICWQPLEIQHTCKCENGKCEKVKEELVEEVIITTDKIEYEQGETVKIMVKNNLDKSIRVYAPLLGIERFDDNNWVPVEMVLGMCGVIGGLVYDTIESYGNMEYNWHQEEKSCDNPKAAVFKPISKQVPIGKYRIKSVVLDFNDADKKKIIHSNEFTIKEKSAVDARCSEKVTGEGNCPGAWLGYEFDQNEGICIKKGVSGCSHKTPFETLEKCQEVCEENSIVISDRILVSLKTIIENKYKSGNSSENIEIAITFIKKPTESQLVEIQDLSNRELVKLFENVYSTSASAENVLFVGSYDFIEKIEYFGGDIILE